MDKIPPQYEENIKAALQGIKRREKNIVALTEEALQETAKPDSVTVNFSSDLADRSVWVDEERILKALVNLFTNAIEAMPDGGELRIGLSGDEERIVMRIADTGRGISRENMDSILTPFFTTKPVGEGTGLGLPFAYGAVKLHSGQFSLESNADPSAGPTGTTITITLPRARPDLSKVIIEE